MFADFYILYFGGAIFAFSLLLFIFTEKSKRKKLHKFISPKLFSSLVPNFSKTRRNLRLFFFFAALTSMFLALARPQWGISHRKVYPSGIDILIAVDVSKSMLARDIRPNRLERVKLGLGNLLEKVKSDRLGLIAFSGSSFLQCPLTMDHQAFQKTLDDLEVSLIKTPGTNLALPIDEASRSFSSDDNDRFLVLLSDGEDLEGEGLRRAKVAKNEGIKIFTIGIGSENGSFIPTDPYDKPAKNFLRDREGKTIVTKMDQESLKNIAEATGGKYFQLGPTGEGLSKTFEILQSIGAQKKRELFASHLPIERYQPFVLLAFLLVTLNLITPTARNKLKKLTLNLIPAFLLFGCLKQENIKRAEMEMENGNPEIAAQLYSLEIKSSNKKLNAVSPKLHLNAGLAHLEAGMLNEAEKFLESSLDASLDDPKIQSIALNALGNVYYRKTSNFLDNQNVKKAKETWSKALTFYNSAYGLNGNDKAKANLDKLNEQIEKRIKSLITIVSGMIWRDLNGDGKIQENEPSLQGQVYWDKDRNGDFNSSLEPKVDSNDNGEFIFEWISSSYPTEIAIGSILSEANSTRENFLVPLFPQPPPPRSDSEVKNHLLVIPQAESMRLFIPYRAAPIISGEIWGDRNENGKKDDNETGYSNAKIFLDLNGNFKLDENESSFDPSPEGRFKFPAKPGQHSVCLELQNKDANVTFPIEDRKAYLTWVDFESVSENLVFGVKDNSQNQAQPENSKNQNNEQSSSANDPREKDNSEAADDLSNRNAQEMNALYERLLQEIESKSQPLDRNTGRMKVLNNGRDY